MAEAPSAFRDVDPEEAGRLLEARQVRPLDVRSLEEHRDLGHLPGSILLPIDLIAAAPGVLESDGLPLLVYCEHGVRSQMAAGFLARAGYRGVLNLGPGMAAWSGPRDYGPERPRVAGPSAWLLESGDLLPRGGRVLDVACGRGRHALLLAGAGFHVRALDADAAAIGWLRDVAARVGLDLDARVVDLEASGVDLGESSCDVILVVHYLHRPLFPALLRALAPGGLLLYETFTVEQARHGGRPRDPRFLLEPGELPRLLAPLEVVRAREGEFEGRWVSSIAARKV
jgi:rhodanese-related sulfurtransferase